MVTVFPEYRLSDVLLESPELINVVDRFGIKLGVGDKSIDVICNQHSISPQFLCAIINVYLGNNTGASRLLRSFPTTWTTEYLLLTFSHIKSTLLPNVDRHFTTLLKMSASKDDGNITIIHKFFQDLRDELIDILDNLSEYWSYAAMHNNFDNVKIHQEYLTDIADKFSDLASFFIIHLKGEYNPNLCRAVVTAIQTVSSEIRIITNFHSL